MGLLCRGVKGVVIEFGLVTFNGFEVGDSLLQGFGSVLKCDGTTILTCNLGVCSAAKFFDVRAHFGCDVFSCAFNVALRYEVEVLFVRSTKERFR